MNSSNYSGKLGKLAVSPEYVDSSEGIGAESRKTILLVEDDDVIRIITGRVIKQLGFSVLLASNGREALDILVCHKNEIDLVVLDIEMPVMSGDKAYRELRRTFPVLPVLFCSGASPMVIEQIVRYDKNAEYLPKPYQLMTLRNILTSMLEKTPKSAEQ
jgi:CheY-like chemotaxis protein